MCYKLFSRGVFGDNEKDVGSLGFIGILYVIDGALLLSGGTDGHLYLICSFFIFKLHASHSRFCVPCTEKIFPIFFANFCNRVY